MQSEKSTATELLNYEADIKIDETALDVEWLNQPMLMLCYAQYAARARRDVDLAKEQLEISYAELDRKIRSSPADYGVDKITESVAQNTILLQREYQLANQQLIAMKYEADMARAAVQAIEQRKDALENLVKLHGQQYFAGPRIPRDLTKEAHRQHQEKEVDAGIAKMMKRKGQER